MIRALDIVKKLVDLKQYKYKHGKDQYYIKEQHATWEMAKSFLEKVQELYIRHDIVEHIFDLDHEAHVAYDEASTTPFHEAVKHFKSGFRLSLERISSLEEKLIAIEEEHAKLTKMVKGALFSDELSIGYGDSIGQLNDYFEEKEKLNDIRTI